MSLAPLRLRPLAVAALIAAHGAAFADPNPYYIGVSETITHDTNVFRSPNGSATSDTYSSTGLLAGIDQPFGRQRFYANGNVRYNHYNDNGVLNNTSYGLNTGLDLSTINHLNGNLAYSANRSLSNFGGINITPSSTKNLETSQELLGRIRWGVVSRMTLDLTGIHRSLDYSDAAFQFNNVKENSGSIGLTYHPSDIWTFGTAYRLSRGEYTVTGADYRRRDVDLTAAWMPTGQSTITGRVSRGKRTSNVNYLDNNDITSGSLAWDYKLTGKSSLRVWASRDTGVETSFFNYSQIAGQAQTSVGDNSSISKTLAVYGTYAATAKIGLNGSVRYIKRELDNSFTLPTGTTLQTGSDTTTLYALSATYQALRSLQFACGTGYEKRSQSGNLSFPYSAKTISCSAQFVLQ